MDSRTRYPLPPVIAPGSPAEQDPANSTVLPGAEWEARGDYRDIRYEVEVLNVAEPVRPPPIPAQALKLEEG